MIGATRVYHHMKVVGVLSKAEGCMLTLLEWSGGGGGVIRPPKKATLRVSTMSPISVAKAERALECCLLMREKGKFKFATRSRLFVFGVGTTAKEGV